MDGHVIHIDFGFMLSNSPGGVNFESAPFKLTRELLEVMGVDPQGRPTDAHDLFDYFKVLCIEGFLACRKHADRVLLLVEMMKGCGCPCFEGGQRALQNLRKRREGHPAPMATRSSVPNAAACTAPILQAAALPGGRPVRGVRSVPDQREHGQLADAPVRLLPEGPQRDSLVVGRSS